MAKVSVIVTTYNRKEYLTGTINSILNQTFSDFELIVVDNFSEYDFFELIASFNDNRIKGFQNANNGVIARNRNIGIKHARYEYLAFCDDDDNWLPKKLETQLQFLINQKFDLVYSNTNLVYETGQTKQTNYSNINTISKLLKHNQITLSSVVLKNNRKVFFNEQNSFVALEDYELWIRLILEGFKFKLVESPLVNYRVTKTSASQQSKLKNEKINLNFRIFLLKKYNFPFSLKLVIVYRICIRSLKYFLFSILKL